MAEATPNKIVSLIMCVSLAFVVSGCGRKPSLAGLKPPPKKEASIVVEQPSQGETTLDGETDGLEPVSKAKPTRKFILDYLL